MIFWLFERFFIIILIKRFLLKKFYKNKNCTLIEEVKNDYEFGLSVYCSSKIKLQKYKIYNFHLGSLFNQRGSFIFYKFIKKWDKVSLTFHEIGERFDVGKLLMKEKFYCKEIVLLLIFFYI